MNQRKRTDHLTQLQRGAYIATHDHIWKLLKGFGLKPDVRQVHNGGLAAFATGLSFAFRHPRLARLALVAVQVACYGHKPDVYERGRKADAVNADILAKIMDRYLTGEQQLDHYDRDELPELQPHTVQREEH